MTQETFALACDHGAVEMKDQLKAHLIAKGVSVIDLGTNGTESVDYPEFAKRMADALKDGQAQRGILLCGSGIGISIAANRFAHVRAALVHDAYGAQMCREHNNANVLTLGARTTGIEVAKQCVDIFLATEFAGGRHARRVDMLGENGQR